MYFIYTFITLAVISIVKEMRDYFSPGNNAELLDILANYAGFIAFVLIVRIFMIVKNKR